MKLLCNTLGRTSLESTLYVTTNWTEFEVVSSCLLRQTSSIARALLLLRYTNLYFTCKQYLKTSQTVGFQDASVVEFLRIDPMVNSLNSLSA